MGFSPPKIPSTPPAPTPPSLPSVLSAKSRTAFGQGKGSLGGTFITGANGMGNVPGSQGQTPAFKTMTGT